MLSSAFLVSNCNMHDNKKAFFSNVIQQWIIKFLANDKSTSQVLYNVVFTSNLIWLLISIATTFNKAYVSLACQYTKNLMLRTPKSTTMQVDKGTNFRQCCYAT